MWGDITGETHIFTLFLTVFDSIFSLYDVIQQYKITHLRASVISTVVQL